MLCSKRQLRLRDLTFGGAIVLGLFGGYITSNLSRGGPVLPVLTVAINAAVGVAIGAAVGVLIGLAWFFLEKPRP